VKRFKMPSAYRHVSSITTSGTGAPMTPTLLQAADALAEALRPLATAPLGEWADHAPDNTNIEGVSLTLGDLRRARTAMAEYEAEPKGWRTMDSAPKDGTRILVLDSGTIEIASYDFNHWWVSGSDSDTAVPTHWMPLPPEPQK